MLGKCGVNFLCLLLSVYWVTAEEHENPFSHVVKHTLITTARNCMRHVNASQTDLEHLREEPPYPDKSACIIKCLLEKIHIVENGKYSKIGFMTAVTPLVFTHRKKLEHMKQVSENCDNEKRAVRAINKIRCRDSLRELFKEIDILTINHHEVEPCQLGNEIITCIFKYAPELHLKAD